MLSVPLLTGLSSVLGLLVVPRDAEKETLKAAPVMNCWL